MSKKNLKNLFDEEHEQNSKINKILNIIENTDNIDKKVNKIKKILDKGFDLNKTYNDKNVLIELINSNLSEENIIVLVQLFIDYNVELNSRDNRGYTPLITATEYNKQKIVRFLISKNCDINFPDSNGRTAVFTATSKFNLDIIKILVLEGDADVNIEDNHGISPFFDICADIEEKIDRDNRSKIFNIIEWYISYEKTNLNTSNEQNQTPLMEVSYTGFVEIVRKLIYNKVDVNYEDESGNTALFYAIEGNELEISKLLVLEGDADINHKNVENFNCLLFFLNYFSTSSDKNFVEFLVNQDPERIENDTAIDLNAKLGENERTIVEICIRNSWKGGKWDEVLDILLSDKIQVDITEPLSKIRNNEINIYIDTIRKLEIYSRSKYINNLETCILVKFPSDFKIFDPIMIEEVTIKDFLEDDDTFVIISLKNENEYSAWGLRVDQLKINLKDYTFAECKKDDSPLFIQISDTQWDKWYTNINDIRDCVPYNIAKLIEKNIIENNQRIFYLTDKDAIPQTTNIKNVTIQIDNTEGYSLNLFNEQIDLTSGTHCGPDTKINVYNQVYITDIEILSETVNVKELKESDECKKLNCGDNQICDVKNKKCVKICGRQLKEGDELEIPLNPNITTRRSRKREGEEIPYHLHPNITTRRPRTSYDLEDDIDFSDDEFSPGNKDKITWFEGSDSFSIGFEMYKGGFPKVSGDDIRSFIKVWIQGAPGIEGQVCQMFYQSSGANSGYNGMWIPTNAITVKRGVGEQKTEVSSSGISHMKTNWEWKWFILKKPWYSGGDPSIPLNRFASDPVIAFVSIMMGNWDEENIKIIMDNLKENYNDELYNILNNYYSDNYDLIKEFFQKNRSNLIDCDEYDINMWVGKCTSWNWHDSFYKDFDYIPDIDPRTGLLWTEDNEGKLFLPSKFLDYPKQGLTYSELKKESENDFKDSKILSKARFNQINRQNAIINKEGKPSNLTTKENLQKRMIEDHDTFYTIEVPEIKCYKLKKSDCQQSENCDWIVGKGCKDKDDLVEINKIRRSKRLEDLGYSPKSFVIAKFDYKSNYEGDINFNKGDAIEYIKNIDKNWFLGKINNQEGIAPVSYVEFNNNYFIKEVKENEEIF
jgi:ankyrin repeat protein